MAKGSTWKSSVRNRYHAVDDLFRQISNFGNPQLSAAELVRREEAFLDMFEDTTSFAKLLADPQTGFILGAHFLGPQASNLVQPIIQAMAFGQTAHDVARGQYWIHPALMEVVENALLDAV